MIKLLLKKFKNFMNFGLILKLGENSNIKMSIFQKKLRIDMREDGWKKKIKN